MESADSLRHQSIMEQLRKEILSLWPCQSLRVSLDPMIPLQQYQDDSCSPPHTVEQDLQPHIMSPDFVMRRQVADSMPGLLRALAKNPPEDLLLMCPGLVYPRGRDGNLQARQELALWRLAAQDLPLSCLDDLIEAVRRILPRGMRLRTRRYERSYLVYGQGLEAYCSGWKWIGHCGLVNPMLLIESGFDPLEANAVALSLDLDRCIELQDKWSELFLRFRSGDPVRTF